MSKPKPLHDRIREAREKAGLTSGSVAAAAGIDRAGYAKIERGDVEHPSWFRIAAIAKVLKIDLNELAN